MKIEYTRDGRKLSLKLPATTAKRVKKLAAERRRREAAKVPPAVKQLLRSR